jgi:hypothetical protein
MREVRMSTDRTGPTSQIVEIVRLGGKGEDKT